MSDNIFSVLDQDWTPKEFEIRRAIIHVAIHSDNPTIIDAFEKLIVLVRLTEPDALNEILCSTKLLDVLAKTTLQRLDRAEAHEIVDETFNSGNNHKLIYALDNFIDVARTYRRKAD